MEDRIGKRHESLVRVNFRLHRGAVAMATGYHVYWEAKSVFLLPVCSSSQAYPDLGSGSTSDMSMCAPKNCDWSTSACIASATLHYEGIGHMFISLRQGPFPSHSRGQTIDPVILRCLLIIFTPRTGNNRTGLTCLCCMTTGSRHRPARI